VIPREERHGCEAMGTFRRRGCLGPAGFAILLLCPKPSCETTGVAACVTSGRGKRFRSAAKEWVGASAIGAWPRTQRELRTEVPAELSRQACRRFCSRLGAQLGSSARTRARLSAMCRRQTRSHERAQRLDPVLRESPEIVTTAPDRWQLEEVERGGAPAADARRPAQLPVRRLNRRPRGGTRRIARRPLVP